MKILVAQSRDFFQKTHKENLRKTWEISYDPHI